MGLFSKIIKNAAVGAMKGTYNAYKSAEGTIRKEIDMARIEDLMEENQNFEKEIAHFSEEERKEILAKARMNAMEDLAKKSAKDKNTLNRLMFKYNLIQNK